MNSYMNFWDKIFNFFGGIWDSFYQSVIYDNRYEFIFEGLLNTIIIAIGAAIIGIVIGIVTALIRNNHDMNGKMKIGNKLSKWYVDIIRGTPSILQLMIIYYVIFKSVNINIVIVGILALVLILGHMFRKLLELVLILLIRGNLRLDMVWVFLMERL